MQGSLAPPSRDVLRPHALDGALLWFHPRTGTHVRWDGPETRSLVRKAPRVVLFGITNRCNLTCSFCSRDRDARSEWTVESAFEVLAGLARRGVLEVAFGGGEPLAFRGFDELVARLGAETALAVHFTTNGTLLTRERLRALAPHVGEIRVSVYDDTPWEAAVDLLADAGVTFGVNVLATPSRLAALPALLGRLAEKGCRDVAVLRYVGMDPASHLRAADERALAAMIASSPVRARLSVCFGDRLHPVPRLFDGIDGDCGAGLDFVTITSDRTVKACSFHTQGVPVRTAEDVLAAWARERERLKAPSPLPGCARPGAKAPRLSDGVRVWRGFSGNNSGECVLVGRFEEVDAARRYLDDLVPEWAPGQLFPAAWRALLEREGIAPRPDELAPESMARVGRTVMLHTDMAAGDDFPSLRTLLWKRGGRAVYSGVHEHDDVKVVAGMRFEDVRALEEAEVALDAADIEGFQRRGLDLYGSVDTGRLVVPDGSRRGRIAAHLEKLEAIARASSGVLAAELAPHPGEVPFPRVLAARPTRADGERMWAWFLDEEKAERAARTLHASPVSAGRYLVVESSRIAPRTGYRAQRAGGTAEWMGGGRVELVATFWREKKGSGEIDLAALRPCLGPGDELDTDPGAMFPCAIVRTSEPGRVLVAVDRFARARELSWWLHVAPEDRLVEVIARLDEDLAEARRAARRP